MATDRGNHERLYRAYAADIFSYLFRNLADRERCEELTHDCFMIFMKRAAKERLNDERCYLFGIAHNVLRAEVRRLGQRRRLMRQVDASSLNPGHAPTPDERLSRNETAELVRDAVAMLTEELRSALILCEYQSCSYEEIAQITDVPVGTVRSRIYRARKELARRLRHHFSTNEEAEKHEL